MCHKYGLHFEEVSERYGILQNSMDNFRGDEIAILYDPGMFPALLTDPNGKTILAPYTVRLSMDWRKERTLNVIQEK